MITLQELRWSNCFSYEDDNKIVLNNALITQLIGENGAGKTSIPLLIQEVLYGKNTKAIKKQDIVNRNSGKKGYYIALDFLVDSDQYTVELDRKSSLKLKLVKNGEDISSHTSINTYKTIAEIIGIPEFKTFVQLIYQSSTQSLEFLTATDTNRKKFLISLLQLEKYIELHELFKTKVKHVSEDIREIGGAVGNLEAWIDKNERLDKTRMTVETVPSVNSQWIDDLTDLKLKLSNIKEINKKIQNNSQYKRMLAELDTDVLVVELPPLESISAIEKSKSEIAGKLAAPLTLINKLSILGEQCPTCLQTINEAHKHSLIEEYTKEVKELKDLDKKLVQKLTEAKKIKADYDRRKKIQEEFEKLHLVIDNSLTDRLENKEGIELEIAKLNQTITDTNNKIAEISTRNSKAAAHNSRIKVVLEQLSEFREQLQEKQKELDNQDSLKSILELLKTTFSTNGLISYKIESSVKELEKVINEYLAEFSHFQIYFKLSGEKLNIEVLDSSGNITGIETLSAGEEARVNISTVLAIRKIMSSLTSTKINFLFLDEIVGVIDDPGKEKLAEVLMEEHLNTFIVSHGWSHPLIPKVFIEKEKNTSRIEYGG